MKFVVYNDWRELPESANALFADGGRTSLFYTRPWFENLSATTLEPCDRLVLAGVASGDRVLALLPLIERDPGVWSSLSNQYTSLYTLLLAGNRQQPVVDCLARGLSDSPLRSLRLTPVADSDPALHALQAALEGFDFACYRKFRFYNWVHACREPGYAGYIAARPAQLRNTIARKQRKLQREHGFDIRLFTQAADLDRALIDYQAIYQASWKASERYPQFTGSLVRTMAETGWLRFAILYSGAHPVAGQIWFVVDQRASIFRLAYDEAWKHYSPGSILTAFMMQQVIDKDGVTEIDYLTGNERYKQDWMSERRERWTLTFARMPGAENRASPLFSFIRDILTRS